MLITAPLVAGAVLAAAAGYGGALLRLLLPDPAGETGGVAEAPPAADQTRIRRGRRRTPGAGAPPEPAAEAPAAEHLTAGPLHAAALGMGLLALLVLAAGLAGLLRPFVLLALLLPGWLLLALRARSLGARLRRLRGMLRPPAGSSEWLAAGLLAAAFVFAAVSLISVFRPPDGLDWDSLSYHLAAPRIYLREGRIGLIAYDSHTNFPFTMQMLYMLGLAGEGPAAARLIHWAAGWMTAAAAGLFAARLRRDAWVGPLAALLFATMPLALWEMGTTYVDLGTALFQMLALTALLDGVRGEGRAMRIDARFAALAGLQSGFALGTKYTALLQFGLLGLGLLYLLWRAAPPARPGAVRAGLIYTALALAVASPWYVKNWLWVHNPVYPFYFSLFPGSFSWDRNMEEAYAGEQKLFGMHGSALEQLKEGKAARVAADALRLPWDWAMHGRAFYITNRSMAGDRIGSLGPFWAGLLPLLFWASLPRGRLLALLLYCLASTAVWFFMSQQSRYLLPVFAPLAVLLALTVAALRGTMLRRAVGLFIGAGLLLNLQMHLPLAEASLGPALNPAERAPFLRRSLPGLYEASEYLNSLPPDIRVALYQETRGFYIERPYFWANPGQHRMISYDDLQRPEELAAELRRFGITHVLINWDFASGVMDHHWFRLVRGAIANGLLQPVFESSNWQPERQGVVVYRLAEPAG